MGETTNILIKRLKESQILMGVKAEDYKELFQKLYTYACEKHLVKETFLEALLEREGKYPTGLNIEGFGFAIPHTDAVHVLEPGVIVVKLDKAVTFAEMGAVDGSVQAEYVFMLLLADDGSQVLLLQDLIALCSDVESVKRLRAADCPQDIMSAIVSFYSETIDNQ